VEVAVVARAGSARRRNLAPPLRSGARSRCGARRGGPAMPPPRRSPLPPRKRPRAVVVSASAPFVLSRSEGREFPCVTWRHRPGRAAAQVRAPRPGTWNGSSLLDTPWQAYRRAYQSAGRGTRRVRPDPSQKPFVAVHGHHLVLLAVHAASCLAMDIPSTWLLGSNILSLCFASGPIYSSPDELNNLRCRRANGNRFFLGEMKTDLDG